MLSIVDKNENLYILYYAFEQYLVKIEEYEKLRFVDEKNKTEKRYYGVNILGKCFIEINVLVDKCIYDTLNNNNQMFYIISLLNNKITDRLKNSK